MTELTGGQENINKFKDLVAENVRNGYNLEFRHKVEKTACFDYMENNFVNACILQFPYGRGGFDELRKRPDGSFIMSSIDIGKYIEHLSRISIKYFQCELFILQLYNIIMKQWMLRFASFRICNSTCVENFAKNLDLEDIRDILNQRKRNGGSAFGSIRYSSSSEFIHAIDAITKALPHTNASARKNKNVGECLQHHFGIATLFITISPDDENNFLIQVWSGEEVQDNTFYDDDNVLCSKAKERINLRINFPGIRALFFEEVLDVVIYELFGWDLVEEAPRDNFDSVFGKPSAFCMGIEEQAHHSLHVHILLWIKEINELRIALCSGVSTVEQKQKAKLLIAQYFDNVAPCSLVDFPDRKTVQKCFDHECNFHWLQRRQFQAVEDQELRNLRHRAYYAQDKNRHVMNCQHCEKGWSAEDMVLSYMKNCHHIHLSHYPENDTRKLKTMILQHQIHGMSGKQNPAIVNAAYNHHIHCKNCFDKEVAKTRSNTAHDNINSECSNTSRTPSNSNDSMNLAMTKRGSKRTNNNVECRHRYPKKQRRMTVFRCSGIQNIKWYKWDGSYECRNVMEIVPERNVYDAFQNVSIRCWNRTKFACNTNLTFLMPGPYSQYVFKYSHKGTQKEDSQTYDKVFTVIEKILSRPEETRSSRSEAYRRVLSTAFAHQNNNVVGATMASYLIRNKSRFVFSHETVWCPLKQFISIINGNDTNAVICCNGKVPFFDCAALHYLCRPTQLESINVFEFYGNYEIVNKTRENESELLDLINDKFQHPSFNRTKMKFLQGVNKRLKSKLVRICQYDFPDTKCFGGNVLDHTARINAGMEIYCRNVLLLLFPFRSKNDLIIEGSYTKKLRSVIHNHELEKPKFEYFLNNVQNCKANCLRVPAQKDELEENTQMYSSEWNMIQDEEEEEVQQNTTGELTGDTLTEFLQLLNQEDISDAILDPKVIDLSFLRKKGDMLADTKTWHN